MTFNSRTYLTLYKYRRIGDTEWKIDSNKACFAHLFNYLQGIYNQECGIEIELTMLYPEYPIHSTAYQPNLCLLDEKEANLYLHELQQWLDFDYFLTITDKSIIVTLSTYLQYGAIKILLTAIRLCYENPYNVCMKETLALHELRVYPELPIIYIYHVIQQCISCFHINTGHCFFHHYNYRLKLETLEELKNKVKNYNDEINHFFSFITPGKISTSFKHDTPDEVFTKDNILLMSDEDIIQRVKKYHINNYKILF